MSLSLWPYFGIWGFIFGTIFGSFLNVVVLRLHSGETLSGRSHCPYCKHTLSTLDLIPLLSFLFLQGRCRYCHKKLSWQYPLVELTTAIAFSTIFISATPLLENGNLFLFLPVLFALFLACVLITVSVFDLKWGIIPDRIVLPASLAAFVYQLLLLALGQNSLENFLWVLVSTAVWVIFFFSLIFFTNGRGMGGGDLKLVLLIGLSMGWMSALVAIFIAFLTGAFIAVMLLLRGKKALKQTIPFGPFLAFGAFAGYLFGDKIFSLYLKTLGL